MLGLKLYQKGNINQKLNFKRIRNKLHQQIPSIALKTIRYLSENIRTCLNDVTSPQNMFPTPLYPPPLQITHKKRKGKEDDKRTENK